MTTYRAGNRQPQNVYRGDQYIGVMFTPEDAALVVEALNRQPYATGGVGNGPIDMTRLLASGCVIEPADSCTCTKAGPDPACVVHEGRRARGPKPPPVGEGCICDGSGRTCPRHGAVI